MNAMQRLVPARIIVLAAATLVGAAFLAGGSARPADAATIRKCTHTKCLTPDACTFSSITSCSLTFPPSECSIVYCQDG